MKKCLMLVGFVLIFASTANSEVILGTDLVSRYVFRGSDYGNSPHIQPYLSIVYHGLEIGTWSAYPLNPDAENPSEEIDIYAFYTLETPIGTFYPTVYDFYYPYAGIDFFDFDDGEGAHTTELSLLYEGKIKILAAMNIYNDEDKSKYVEVGYSHEIGDVTLDIFAGAGIGESLYWYRIEDTALINVGITGTKEIEITDKFKVPVYTSFILNPDLEKGYMVFGASF